MTQTSGRLLCVMRAIGGDYGGSTNAAINATGEKKRSNVTAALHCAHDSFFADRADLRNHRKTPL
jgi:hypothetical protein